MKNTASQYSLKQLSLFLDRFIYLWQCRFLLVLLRFMALRDLPRHYHCPCFFLRVWEVIAKYQSILFWKQIFPNSQAHLLKEAHSLLSEVSYSVMLYATHVDETQTRMNHWRNLTWNQEIIVVIQGSADTVMFTAIPTSVTGGLSLFLTTGFICGLLS